MADLVTRTELNDLLKSRITKDELNEIFNSRRSDTHAFIDVHDRTLRDIETRIDTKINELGVINTSLSSVLRLMTDTNRNHEDRIARLEEGAAVAKQERLGLYNAMFGDVEHPDQESFSAMLKNRYIEAKDQHKQLVAQNEEILVVVRHLEDRQDETEKVIANWKKIYTLAFDTGAKLIKSTFASWQIKTAILALTGFLAARVADPQLMNDIGVLLVKLLGIK